MCVGAKTPDDSTDNIYNQDNDNDDTHKNDNNYSIMTYDKLKE